MFWWVLKLPWSQFADAGTVRLLFNPCSRSSARKPWKHWAGSWLGGQSFKGIVTLMGSGLVFPSTSGSFPQYFWHLALIPAPKIYIITINIIIIPTASEIAMGYTLSIWECELLLDSDVVGWSISWFPPDVFFFLAAVNELDGFLVGSYLWLSEDLALTNVTTVEGNGGKFSLFFLKIKLGVFFNELWHFPTEIPLDKSWWLKFTGILFT